MFLEVHDESISTIDNGLTNNYSSKPAGANKLMKCIDLYRSAMLK